ncbi:hypothetical protein NLX83_38065 [Allokutzneria sp. A3M-2-11 16]|uniref:AMIN-like domain-containing (lipo)protein n=1 Tax=Allokutzneria sp. A3M-2-11 16 TaxID=2962043 RepID=UPI0020B81A52|nr:hypothetical protein [Allokutzneria sp. A3M-2-11 16]MCP3805087.1 hypothetical protein [Allokutzneria sp. A3M-2-11 16]
MKTLWLAAVLLMSTLACGAPHQNHSTVPAPRPSAPPPQAVSELQGPGVLSSINVGKHPGYDRVVFTFDAAVADHNASYVDQVTQDGSGFPVPLRGSAFLQLTIRGATTDNQMHVTDPGQLRTYKGPQRITPQADVVAEIASAGDFEGDLSFGIGLTRKLRYEISKLTAPTRVVVDFFHTG